MDNNRFREELESADNAVNKILSMIDVLQNASTGVHQISEETIELYMAIMQEYADSIKTSLDAVLNDRKEN